MSDDDLQAFAVLLGGSGASRVRGALSACLRSLCRMRALTPRTLPVSAATIVTAVLALVVGSEQFVKAFSRKA